MGSGWAQPPIIRRPAAAKIERVAWITYFGMRKSGIRGGEGFLKPARPPFNGNTPWQTCPIPAGRCNCRSETLANWAGFNEDQTDWPDRLLLEEYCHEKTKS